MKFIQLLSTIASLAIFATAPGVSAAEGLDKKRSNKVTETYSARRNLYAQRRNRNVKGVPGVRGVPGVPGVRGVPGVPGLGSVAPVAPVAPVAGYDFYNGYNGWNNEYSKYLNGEYNYGGWSY